MSSILYSAESWLTNSISYISPVNHLYISSIKYLLGVRKSTSNNLCLIEIGYAPLQYFIKNIQSNYFKKILSEREGLTDDPFMTVFNLCKSANTPEYKYIKEVYRRKLLHR